MTQFLDSLYQSAAHLAPHLPLLVFPTAERLPESPAYRFSAEGELLAVEPGELTALLPALAVQQPLGLAHNARVLRWSVRLLYLEPRPEAFAAPLNPVLDRGQELLLAWLDRLQAHHTLSEAAQLSWQFHQTSDYWVAAQLLCQLNALYQPSPCPSA